MPGLGLSIPEVAGRGSVDPAAAALIARMSAAPGVARIGAVDAAVRALKAGGVWAKLSVLNVMAAHDAQAARLNWVQPSYGLSEASGPAFTADRGYAGNGTSSYLETGWSPSLGQQDSVCLGVWSRTNAQSAFGLAGLGTAAGFSVNPRSVSDTAVVRINQGSNSAASGQTDATGLVVGNRSAANAVQIYRNGAAIGGASTASTTPSGVTVNVGRVNGAFVASQVAALVIGASLDAGEQAALYQALAGYMAAVGA